MTVTFRCRHAALTVAMAPESPACPTCGDRTVTRVDGAVPVFRGRAFGPHSLFAPLDAAPVRLYEE